MADTTCSSKILIKDHLLQVVPPEGPLSQRDRAVVFVHGFQGDGRTTWKLPDAPESFPGLIATDHDLADHDVFVFQYVTKDLRPPAIDNIVIQLKFALREHVKHSTILFIAHSMGGLVCIRTILALLEDGQLHTVGGLLLYGSPMTGVEWAKYAQLVLQVGAFKLPLLRFFSHLLKTNKQIEALTSGSEFIDRLNGDWVLRALNGGHPKVPADQRAWLPVRVVSGNDDWVVKESSARGFYSKIDWINVDQDHRALVKPADRSDFTYQVARDFLRDCRKWMDPPTLLKLRRQIDSLWEHHRSERISNWRFNLLFEKDQVETVDTGFGMLGFRSFKVLECSYRRRLPANYVKFGFANGNIAAGQIWTDEFAFLHSIRFGALPSQVAAGIQEQVRKVLENDEDAWDRLFRNINVRIYDAGAGSGTWHTLVPTEIEKNNDALVRRFELPSEALHLVGKEVTIDTRFTSVLPLAINDYTVEFPWLCDSFDVSVTIRGEPSYFVTSQALRGIATVQSKREQQGKLEYSSKDLILPGSYFLLEWNFNHGG